MTRILCFPSHPISRRERPGQAVLFGAAVFSAGIGIILPNISVAGAVEAIQFFGIICNLAFVRRVAIDGR